MVRRALTPVLALALLPILAAAQPTRRLGAQAADHLDDARQAARRARGACRPALAEALERAEEQALRLRKARRPEPVDALLDELGPLSARAAASGCPAPVGEGLRRAQAVLQELRQGLAGGRGTEDEDDQDRLPRPPPGAIAVLGPLAVRPASTFEDEPAVRVSVPELRLTGLRGRTFYFGARFRCEDGPWSEWVTTQQWSIGQDPLVWRNPFIHFFRASSLAEVDDARGRFVAQVAVFDGPSNQPLATREAPFRAVVPQLDSQPKQLPPPPPMRPQPPQDCGTGGDPGCGRSRDGQVPMDGTTYQGLLAGLSATPNELERKDLCEAVLGRQALTALQLGGVLRQFPSELLRLDVARLAAPKVVDPEHALGLAATWRNSLLGQDYTRLMAAQLR